VESIELHDFARVDEAARIGRDHCHRQLAASLTARGQCPVPPTSPAHTSGV
jgi:hypothetical protein